MSKKVTFKNFIYSKPSKASKRPKRLKKGVYGMDQPSAFDSAGALSEHSDSMMGMHNGVIPGAFDSSFSSFPTKPKRNSDDFFKREYTEEDEEATKIDSAKVMFKGLVNQGLTRREIINMFMRRLGVTESTAVSYYERIAKEAGLTNMDIGRKQINFGYNQPMGTPGQNMPASGTGASSDMGGAVNPLQQELPPEEPEGVEVSGDPNKQGLIRRVKGAHLVYKRQEEEGTYEELWVYNTGKTFNDEFEIRRAILAGTDIPSKKTQSNDGKQSYTLKTMGNAQLLHIVGLPN